MLCLCVSCDKYDENKGKQQMLQGTCKLALTFSYRKHTKLWKMILTSFRPHTSTHCIAFGIVFVRQNDSTHPSRQHSNGFLQINEFFIMEQNVNETNNSHEYVLDWLNVLISSCDRQIDFGPCAVLCCAMLCSAMKMHGLVLFRIVVAVVVGLFLQVIESSFNFDAVSEFSSLSLCAENSRIKRKKMDANSLENWQKLQSS